MARREGAMMTRREHLQWAKQRALLELDSGGDRGVINALASMGSDLSKHPETSGHLGLELGMMLAMNGHLNTPAQMREWINGFN